MANTRTDVVAAARAERGTTESPAGSNRQKYGKAYGFDGVPWCAIYLSVILAQVGNRSGYRFASTAASVAWARRAGRLRSVSDARAGDIVVRLYTPTTGHTGLVVANEGGTLVTVEGNTSGGNDRDGGSVQERRRSSSWWGYCIGMDYDGAASSPPPPAPGHEHPTSGPPFPGRVLRRGVQGADVRTWQQKMKDRGWSRMAVDGDYGPTSADLCTQFQREKGLEADGEVGNLTWTATFR